MYGQDIIVKTSRTYNFLTRTHLSSIVDEFPLKNYLAILHL